MRHVTILLYTNEDCVRHGPSDDVYGVLLCIVPNIAKYYARRPSYTYAISDE